MKVDGLIDQVRQSFEQIADHRSANSSYSLTDCLMGGFSIFHQKEPSLLAYREMYPYRESNLKQIYGFSSLPNDSGLRKCLDGVSPSKLMPSFKHLLCSEQALQVLSSKYVLGEMLAVSVDGTGHFCSSSIRCSECMARTYKSGEQQYYHQLLGACIVNPGQSTVIPVAAEAIVKQDGQQKNDCERNAAKRLLPLIRQHLPSYKLVALFDGLYADGPTIRALQEQQMHFITTIKEGYVLIQAQRLFEQNQLQEHIWYDGDKRCIAHFAQGLILNGANQDITVNYIHYQEVDKKTAEVLYKHEWITDLPLNTDKIKEIIEVARARWKIENETFNTLKNQGYHLEHNYGHGKKHLATVFAFLMFLAFMVDQMAQCADQAFQKAMALFKTKKAFWKRVSQIFDLLPAVSMNIIYQFMAGDVKVSMPKLE